MIETRMYCENCGKEFAIKHFEGNYIDHMNMVNNFDKIYNNGIDDVVDEICCNGNRYRELDDIDSRLVCFVEYLYKNKKSIKTIKEIKERVKNKKRYISDLIKTRKEMQDKIYSFDDYKARAFIKESLFV